MTMHHGNIFLLVPVPERILAGEPRSDIFPHPPHVVNPADITPEVPPTANPVLPRESVIPPEITNPAEGKVVLLFMPSGDFHRFSAELSNHIYKP